MPHRLQLERLGLDETGELIQRALDLKEPPVRFSTRLYAETEGNPFFVTETLRTLMDDGLLYRDADGYGAPPGMNRPRIMLNCHCRVVWSRASRAV